MAFLTKITGLTAIVVAASLAGKVVMAEFVPDSNIVASCAYTGANLTSYIPGATHNMLGAYCVNDVNVAALSYTYTWLNLDYCLSNNAGQLVVSPSGNFSSTCSKCSLDTSNQTVNISCSCFNKTQVLLEESSLDITDWVGTKNGTFICLGHYGTSVENDTVPLQPNWG